MPHRNRYRAAEWRTIGRYHLAHTHKARPILVADIAAMLTMDLFGEVDEFLVPFVEIINFSKTQLGAMIIRGRNDGLLEH